jgi:methionine sulfoxide reductase heme-binding subunit
LRIEDCGLRRLIKPLVFVACLVPLAWLTYGALMDALGANPIEEITNETGVWTLRFLAITLLITPLRKLTKWNVLIRYRRMFGLFAFFYGCLHFTTYVWLDQFFVLHDIVKDVMKRPFITVGFTAFVLMIPLALTSTAGSIRRLGGKRWNLLHRLIYVSAVLGVIHYLWLVKADTIRPIRYGVIIGVLLVARAAFAWRRRLTATASRAPGADARLRRAADA